MQLKAMRPRNLDLPAGSMTLFSSDICADGNNGTHDPLDCFAST